MPILLAFLDIAGQWRTVATADGRVLHLALDYTAVRHGLELGGTRLTPAQWRGVQVLERAAGDALNGVRG